MPRKIFSIEDIQEIYNKERVNKKRQLSEYEKSRNQENTTGPTANSNNVVLISNKEEIVTDFNVSADREYYDRKSFESTFDTEIAQLKTGAPPVEPDPDPKPPPAPTVVQVRCTNHHWTLDGGKGRTEKDKPAWHHNHHPLGNNPDGGALVIPNDHPLFFLRRCEPADARRTFNFEWKVDGKVVSEAPYFHMFNATDQKPEDNAWRKAPDIIIEVRVWNESGEKTAKMKMRCASSIGDDNHLEDDGKPKPRWKWKGTRYFREEEFWKGGWKVYTDYQLDTRYKPRKVYLSKITLDDFDQLSYTKASKFAAKPWNNSKGISKQLLPDMKKPERRDSDYAHHSRNWSKWRKEHMSIFHSSRFNPWNRNKHSFIGEVYINGEWVTFPKIWSGYESEAALKDKYDAKNFMRLDEDGKPAFVRSNTKDGDKVGTTLMQKINKQIFVTAPIGEKVTFAFKYGFKKSSANKGELEYVIFTGYKTHTVKEEDGEKVWLNVKLKTDIIKYDKDVYDYEMPDGEEQTDGEFTKSTATSRNEKRTTTSNRRNMNRGGGGY